MSERDKLIAPVEEPWCYGVESSHSGDVVVRETFDDEETALLHAHMNGGQSMIYALAYCAFIIWLALSVFKSATRT